MMGNDIEVSLIDSSDSIWDMTLIIKFPWSWVNFYIIRGNIHSFFPINKYLIFPSRYLLVIISCL